MKYLLLLIAMMMLTNCGLHVKHEPVPQPYEVSEDAFLKNLEKFAQENP